MFLNVFGRYLVDEGKLTEEQFAVVKESQKQTRVKLGLIAVSEKLIDEKQAEEINRKQAVMDKRFGDIAVELGYLTGDQVSMLLDLQGNAYMVFCQTVTDKEYMTLVEIESALKSFAAVYSMTDDDIEAFKSDDFDKIVPLFIPGDDCNVKDLICVAVRTLNRLISTDISIKPGKLYESYNASKSACQSLEGDKTVITAFSGDDAGILYIAEKYAMDSFDAVDEDALDSVAEFINIVNGLYATSLSYQRVSVEMMPPNLYPESHEYAGSHVYVIPLMIENSEVDLIITEI